MEPEGSITRCIGLLKAGDRAAAQPLWERYFRRLVGLARARLRGRPARAADEEDVALSAFDSFCRRAEARPVPPAGGPRRPLAAAVRPHRPQGRQPRARTRAAPSRGGGRVLTLSDLAGPDVEPAPRPGADARAGGPGGRGVPAAAGRPGRRRRCGGWPCGRWRATPTPRSPRSSAASSTTVERKLQLIRELWAEEVDAMSGDRRRATAPSPPTLARRVDEACDRFEAAWKAGRRPRIEDSLAEVPEPGRPALLRELLVARAGLPPPRRRAPGARRVPGAVPGPTAI